MNRQQVIDTVGIKAVQTVESLNCEPTNGLGYCGAAHDDELTEWSAWTPVDHEDYDQIIVYYYTTNADDAKIAELDGSAITWTPERFALV